MADESESVLRDIENVEHNLKEAIELRDTGRYTQATDLLRSFTKKHQFHAESLSLLTQVLLLQNQIQEAEKYLNLAISINPTLPSIGQNRIRLLLKYGRNNEALELALQIVDASSMDLEGLLLLAACYVSNQQDNAALPLIERILKGDPEYAEAYANRAIINLRQGNTNAAIDDAKMSLSIKPHLTNIWLFLASIYFKRGELTETCEALKAAVKIEPQNHEILIQLGEVLHQRGEDTEALGLYKRVTELSPKNPKAWIGLGVLLQKNENFSEAKLAYEKALSINPNIASVLNNLGNMALNSQDFEAALKHYQNALKIDPNLGKIYSNLGVALEKLGRLSEAQITYQKAIKLEPGHAETYQNLGNTLKQLGRIEDAENNYRKALSLKPDLSSAHSSLGDVLKELGRSEDAVSSFQQAFANRTGISSVKDNKLAPATTSVLFELTNKCNFHCTFCPSDLQKRSLGFMNLNIVKKLYKETAEKKIATQVGLHVMGEPTLHPNLIEILNFGASLGVRTDLVTNISTLVEKNIPKILDSLSGTLTASHMTPTKKSYRYRGEVGLPWERYIGNLRLLVREYMYRLAEGKPMQNDITIRVMVTQDTASNASIIETENEARSVLKEWNDFVSEIELELGLPAFERVSHLSDNLVRNNDYSHTSYLLQRGIKLAFWRAFTFANTRVSEEFVLEPGEQQKTYCSKPFTDVGVLWNGDVTLCNLDHDGQLKVGNINETSIENVIQNRAAQKIRASMLGEASLPAICQTCQQRPIKRENA